MIELSIEVSGAPEDLIERLNQVSELCCREEGLSGAISFGRLVDDGEIRRMNREFRGIDSATDVLSFPSIAYRHGQTAASVPQKLRRERDPETGLPHIGDFAISLMTAQRQAQEYGHSLERELCYLTAHALFHLMGYDHQTEEDKPVMRAKEERAMDQLNLRRPE